MKKIALILPCYNEAEDLQRKVETIKEYISKREDYSFSIVVVNDGSKDNTAEVASSIEGIELVSYTPNGGKGHAVREGLHYCVDKGEADAMVFMDADLSTDLNCLPALLEKLDEVPFAVGSRYDKESNIVVKQPFKRRFVSFCSHIIIRTMFRFGIKDTQCGFKALSKDFAKLIVEKSQIDGFSFDVEYLYIAKLNKVPYVSVPVTWTDDRGSTVKVFKSSVRFFFDLFKIKGKRKSYKA